MKCRYGEWVDSGESVCTKVVVRKCKKIAFIKTVFYERNITVNVIINVCKCKCCTCPEMAVFINIARIVF